MSCFARNGFRCTFALSVVELPTNNVFFDPSRLALVAAVRQNIRVSDSHSSVSSSNEKKEGKAMT